MAFTPLNQLAPKISQLSCFACLEGGECSASYGSSTVLCMKCQKAKSCIADSRLKPNLLGTVQEPSSQVRRACITWPSTLWVGPAELLLLAQKWPGMLFALPLGVLSSSLTTLAYHLLLFH